MALAIHLPPGLDADVVAEAVAWLWRRHAGLRTAFRAQGGEPVPWTLHHDALVVDRRTISRPALPSCLEADEREPFDLSTGPLLRARLYTVEDRLVLSLAMHHIVGDGWSLHVLLDELATVYDALWAGRPVSLPPLTVDFHDWAAWQWQWLDSPPAAQQRAYWQQRLSGGTGRLALPTDRPHPLARSGRGGRVLASLDLSVTQALERLGRHEGCTPYMTLLAGLVALLARYTGQTDLWVGSPVANRRQREVEGVLGPFVNTLVLRNEVDLQASFRRLLSSVRNSALDAYAHQDVPFEQVVEDVQPERWLGLDHKPTPLENCQFGGGAHFCLGYHMALLEGTMFLVQAARTLAAAGRRPQLVGDLPRANYVPLIQPPRKAQLDLVS